MGQLKDIFRLSPPWTDKEYSRWKLAANLVSFGVRYDQSEVPTSGCDSFSKKPGLFGEFVYDNNCRVFSTSRRVKSFNELTRFGRMMALFSTFLPELCI